METTNYGHLSRQLKEVRDRISVSPVRFEIGNIDFLIGEINRLERIVSALESIGVNLDEEDIVALEGIAKDDEYRSCVRENVNRAMGDWWIDWREGEQSNATAALAAAGFVLNDDDGETWVRGANERVVIELTNGREARYKWNYDHAQPDGATDICDSGVSGEFHRLLALIGAGSSGDAATGAEKSSTEAKR